MKPKTPPPPSRWQHWLFILRNVLGFLVGMAISPVVIGIVVGLSSRVVPYVDWLFSPLFKTTFEFVSGKPWP